MFNVDGKEFIFLVLIALVVLGPEKLPDLFRRAGKAYSEFRRLSEGFQEEFRRAVEEPIGEVRATGELVRESVDLRTTVTTQPASNDPTSDDPASDDPADDAADDADGMSAEKIDPRVHEVELPSFHGDGVAAHDDTDGPSDPDGRADPASTPVVETVETVGTAEFEVIDADLDVSGRNGQTSTASTEPEPPHDDDTGSGDTDVAGADRAEGTVDFEGVTSAGEDPGKTTQR